MPSTRKPTRKPDIPAPEGFRGCCRCREVKPVSEFHPKAKGSALLMSYCKPCRRIQRKEAGGRQQDPTAEARFWEKVAKTADGCWNWIGGTDHRGYGFFYFRGDNWRAHRVSMIFAGVDVPPYTKRGGDAIVVDHICKNLGCVRPDHLRLVRQSENCCELAPKGVSFANKVKTHCKRGHPFDTENTMRVSGGAARECRICHRLRWQRWRDRQATKVHSPFRD